MKVRTIRDMKAGAFLVRFSLEDFTNEEVFYMSKYGTLTMRLPYAIFQHPRHGSGADRLTISLQELPDTTFSFSDSGAASGFVEEVIKIIKEHLDLLIAKANEFVGETVFEVKAGEEIRRISEGARRALDRNSEEYKEVIEKNREAFEKLSKL